jgi:hypothetical protein
MKVMLDGAEQVCIVLNIEASHATNHTKERTHMNTAKPYYYQYRRGVYDRELSAEEKKVELRSIYSSAIRVFATAQSARLEVRKLNSQAAH